MSVLYPGAMPLRPRRASSLIFGWRAGDGTLDAYTGQAGTLSTHATAAGPIAGINAITVTGARKLPRFTAAFDSTTRLRLQGDVTSTYDERVTYPFPIPVQTLTVFLRLRSMYGLNAGGVVDPGNFALAIGTASTSGGRLTISRSTGGVWRARRWKDDPNGGSQLITATETGSWVSPFDFLLTLNSGGSISFQIRDGAGTTQHSSTSAADADLVLGSDSWAGGLLILGAGLFPPAGTERGIDADYETIKIARGVKTLTVIDGLT